MLAAIQFRIFYLPLSCVEVEMKLTAFWDIAPCSLVDVTTLQGAIYQNAVIFILAAVKT
jgi:hypothetical protein